MNYVAFTLNIPKFTIKELISHKITEIENCRTAKKDMMKSQMNYILTGAILNAIDDEIVKLKGELILLVDKL